MKRIILFLLIVLVGVVGADHVHKAGPKPDVPINAATRVDAKSSHIPGHAIVPGGIHTFPELAENAYWYPGCDTTHAEFTFLTEPTNAYISYRGDDNEMHWTHTKRLINPGEAVIVTPRDTGGSCVILQRCGNLISYNPPPLLAEYPVPADVYPPVFSVNPADPEVPLPSSHPTPSAITHSVPGVSSVTPQANSFPGVPILGTITPVNVSEPSTLAQLSFTLILLNLVYIVWRIRKL